MYTEHPSGLRPCSSVVINFLQSCLNQIMLTQKLHSAKLHSAKFISYIPTKKKECNLISDTITNLVLQQ